MSTHEPVQKEQCRKAVMALVKHVQVKVAKKAETDLLAEDRSEKVFLVITLKRESGHARHKPIRIPVPHPVMDPRRSPVCLFVKDPQREYKDLLKELDISFISRVVGVGKLKGKHKAFEARRELMRQHELFLADDRVLPTLPKLLGEKFISKKRPIPVRLEKKSAIKAELEKAIASAYLVIGLGSCITVKIGEIGLNKIDALQENLQTAIEQIVPRLPYDGWDNVQALHVKTSTSVSLPVWTCSLTDENDPSSRFYTKPEPVAQEAE